MKTALITGVNGQDGAYLSDFLLTKGYEVYGLIKDDKSDLSNLDYFGIRDKVELIMGNIKDKDVIDSVISERKPDEIYNLGGLTSPGESWDLVDEYVDVNIHSVVNLIDSIKKYSPHSRFFQASTSEMFGNSHNEGLQTEDTAFHPTNPYAVTKLFGYWMTNVYKESHNMYIANGILFNHESPIRNIKFVTRKISNGIARIHLGLDDSITLGNIDAKRDWGFAGDFVEAMWLILQQDRPDNYILSTGEIHTIRDFLTIGFNHIGIANFENYIKIDPRFNRPINLTNLYGKNDKAKDVLGWIPKMNFESLVKLMVDEDIRRLSLNGN